MREPSYYTVEIMVEIEGQKIIYNAVETRVKRGISGKMKLLVVEQLEDFSRKAHEFENVITYDAYIQDGFKKL